MPRRFFTEVSQDGLLHSAGLENHIRSAIRAIALTRTGERPLHPNVGSTLQNWMYRIQRPGVQQEISDQLKKAILLQEDRIEIDTLTVARSDLNHSRLKIGLRYRQKGARRFESLEVLVS